MSIRPEDQALADVRSEMARLRRLVLLLSLPWLLFAIGALAPADPDVLTAKRFIVVDEQGEQRATLSAPSERAPQSSHGVAKMMASPQLVLTYEDGREVKVGGANPQVRVGVDDRYTGMQQGGFFTVQDSPTSSASTKIGPYRLSVTVSNDDGYHDISLDAWADDSSAQVVVTVDEEESIFPAKR